MEGTLPFLLVVLLAGGTVSKRHSRKTQSPLENWQKQFLQKIRGVAQQSGLSESELNAITKYDKDVCYERACLESAYEILQATNFSVDPCNMDTWLNYACMRRVNEVDNLNQVTRAMHDVSRQTTDILENGLPNGEGDDYLLNEAQFYYSQCKNKHHHDKKDVRDILRYLSEKYGGWPIFTNRDPGENFDWMRMVADLNRLEKPGFEPLVFKVSWNGVYLQLDPGKSTFAYSQADIVAVLTRIQKASGSDRPARTDQIQKADQALHSLRLYENNFQQIVTISDLQNMTDNIEFLQNNQRTEAINWLDFFQRVMQGTDVEITSDTPVNVAMKDIRTLVTRVEADLSNNPKGIANLLHFQLAILLLQENTVLLDDLKSFQCTEQSGTRQSICYTRVLNIFGYSLGNTWLSVYYNPESTSAIEELWEKLKTSYINTIMSYGWMEKSTKKYLKEKIESFKFHVPQAPFAEDPEQLQEFYKALKVNTDKSSSAIKNYLAVNRWETAAKRKFQTKVISISAAPANATIYDTEWTHFAGTVNAQFHKILNSARVIGGITQAPLFGVGRPGFMNYGGTGMVLGHEIGHSFDTMGIGYNKNSQLCPYKDGYPNNCWDKKSRERYELWTDSIVNFYNSEAHQISETSAETTDSTRTLNENIADLIGIEMSFRAYKLHLDELETQGKQEKILPGLKSVSPERLFYMKYANMWCDKKGPQDVLHDLMSIHSPGNTRASMPLKRSKQFAETFGCPVPNTEFAYRK